MASEPHLHLIRAPYCYGVTYVDLVSSMLFLDALSPQVKDSYVYKVPKWTDGAQQDRAPLFIYTPTMRRFLARTLCLMGVHVALLPTWRVLFSSIMDKKGNMLRVWRPLRDRPNLRMGE